MLKRVETEQDLAYYNFIWMTAWREKGYEFEFASRVLDRYVVVTPEGHYIGTAEYKPFRPDSGSFESVADIGRMPVLTEDRQKVAEIDKFALLPEYRGKYVNDLVSSVLLVAREHGIRYFVTLLEPLFYRALRLSFRAPMTLLGPKTFYKGDYVLPVVIDVKEILARPDRFGVKEPSVLTAAGNV